MTVSNLIRFKPEFWHHVVWSQPDAPTPSICSCCQGALPEVPLMMWREDSSAISICDQCVADYTQPGDTP